MITTNQHVPSIYDSEPPRSVAQRIVDALMAARVQHREGPCWCVVRPADGHHLPFCVQAQDAIERAQRYIKEGQQP